MRERVLTFVLQILWWAIWLAMPLLLLAMVFSPLVSLAWHFRD
jgi:hypothetical protein